MKFRLSGNRFLSLCILAGCFSTASASDYMGEIEDTDHFGLRIQFDLNHSHNWNQFIHWSPGASIGGVYYAPFGRFTYFNVGVLVSYNTFDIHGTSGTKYHPYEMDGSIRAIGLRMPIDFGFKYYENNNVRLSVYSGPHLYFNFHIETEFDRHELDYTDNWTHVKKKIDNSGMEIAWSIGTAIDFKQKWHFQFEYNHALSNLGLSDDYIPRTTINIKRGELCFGVGYNF